MTLPTVDKLEFVFSTVWKISNTVTRPWTFPCWSTTGKARCPNWQIFSIICSMGVSGVIVWTGLVIIHLILICSEASSIGLCHLANIGLR